MSTEGGLLNPEGGDKGAEGEGATPPPAGGTGAGVPEWDTLKGALPDDIKNDPAFGPITSLEGLAKSFVHGQKAIGKDKVPVPDKHATEEDWQGVFTKLGNPEKIEDYQLNLGDDVAIDENIMSKVKEAAHKKGVLPWQLEAIVKEFNGAASELIESQETEYKASRERQIQELKDSWGTQFDDQVSRANAAMRHFLPDTKDQQALIDAGLGTNPAVIRLLANASKMMSEDDFVGQVNGRGAGLTPEAALQKARDIQGDMNHPYRNPTHPNHKAAKDEVRNLYEIAFPE